MVIVAAHGDDHATGQALDRWRRGMAAAVSVAELLDGHVEFEVECSDRIYLNADAPKLQTPGVIVWFLREHLDQPIASPW